MEKSLKTPEDFAVHIRKMKEEVRKGNIKRYEEDSFTFLDHWPDTLERMSLPTMFIPITPEQLDVLISQQDFEEDEDTAREQTLLLEPLKAQIEQVLFQIGVPVFFRLNSRSPKDVMHLCVSGDAGQMLHMLGLSERTMIDMMMFRDTGKPCYICLRPPVYMPRLREFRAFVKDGEVLGISQYYHHMEDDGWIAANIGWLHTNLIKTASAVKVLTAPHTSVVVDLWVKSPSEIVVLEINPYGKSDPCLFHGYDVLETQKGGLKYRMLGGKVITHENKK